MKKFLVGFGVLLVSCMASGATKTTPPTVRHSGPDSSSVATTPVPNPTSFTSHVITGADNEHIVYLDPVHALKFRVTPDSAYLTSDGEKMNVDAFVKDAKSIQLAPKAPLVKESIDLPPVHALVINGPFTFHITTGVKSERIVLFGIDHPTSALKVDIKPEAVYLSSGQKGLYMDVSIKDLNSLILKNLKDATIRAAEPTNVSVYASNVASLHINGPIAMPLFRLDGQTSAEVSGNINIQQMLAAHSGQVQIQDLASDSFELNQTGNGDIWIQADVTNIKVDHRGRGHLQMNPLHNYSFSLNDNGDQGGSVHLIGNTHRLTANLGRQANLEAYHFMADLIYMRTADGAVAHINPLDRLFASSTGVSKIDYIHEPEHQFLHSSIYSHILYLANP